MVLLEQYYEVSERENVTKRWRGFQTTSYIVSAVTGILSGFMMGALEFAFDGTCFLSARVVLTTSPEGQYMFDNTLSMWGSDTHCYFCQYSMICSFICSVIWFTFFWMCGRGGKAVTGLSQPWRIVMPALIFNIIYFIISLTALVIMSVGISDFCSDFDKKSNEIFNSTPEKWPLQFYVNSTSKKSCEHINEFLPTMPLYNNAGLYIRLMEDITWICFTAWFLNVAILVLRLCLIADFKIDMVYVHSTKEEQSNVVDPEESNIIDLEQPSTSGTIN